MDRVADEAFGEQSRRDEHLVRPQVLDNAHFQKPVSARAQEWQQQPVNHFSRYGASWAHNIADQV